MTDKKNDEIYNLQGELVTAEEAQSNLSKNLELIQRAIYGEKRAFEQLYMQSYRYVFFVVRDFIADDETTYDSIQETFIKVFKGICDLRSPQAYFSWLTTIAKIPQKIFCVQSMMKLLSPRMRIILHF